MQPTDAIASVRSSAAFSPVRNCVGAMSGFQLATGRIWDYECDVFVHRRCRHGTDLIAVATLRCLGMQRLSRASPKRALVNRLNYALGLDSDVGWTLNGVACANGLLWRLVQQAAASGGRYEPPAKRRVQVIFEWKGKAVAQWAVILKTTPGIGRWWLV